MPTTDSTRPPAETTAPSSRRRVPACSTPSPSDARHDVAQPRGARVVAGGDDHRDRGAVAPLQRRLLRQRSGRDRVQEPGQRRPQQREDDLGLGVAEPAVELDDLRAGRRQRQAGVEQAGERRAAGDEFRRDGCHDARDDLVDQTRRRPGQRCVGAHAAGVGPGVVVADPLEVLRGQQRHHRRAVHQAEQRHLRTVEVRLEQYRVPVVQQAHRVGARGVEVLGDDHALAGGQAVVLDHVGRGEARPARRRGGPGCRRSRRRRWARRPRP